LSIAATPLPPGWREPLEKEANQEWRKESPTLYLSSIGDFNGDGVEDQAKLLVRENDEAVALFVIISDKKDHKTYKLDQSEGISTLDVMGIDIAPIGSHKTACGKGYWNCDQGEPEIVKLKNPAIDYFCEESANSFFIWNEKSQDFDRVWISD
jgi:hypothetical protein